MRSLLLLLFFTCSLFLNAQRSDFDTISFEKADHIAKRYAGEELTNLPVLALRLTAQLETDIEKFRAIYFWVTHNIRGDYHTTSANNYMHKKLQDNPAEFAKWNSTFRKELFSQLREKKQTICTGYAYLIKELANLVGLQCEIVNGYGKIKNVKFDNMKIPNHSWNAVQLNSKWYLCDATWSSGVIHMSDYSFEFKYDDSFFLMEPSEFAINHRPIEARWLLGAKDVEK